MVANTPNRKLTYLQKKKKSENKADSQLALISPDRGNLEIRSASLTIHY